MFLTFKNFLWCLCMVSTLGQKCFASGGGNVLNCVLFWGAASMHGLSAYYAHESHNELSTEMSLQKTLLMGNATRAPAHYAEDLLDLGIHAQRSLVAAQFGNSLLAICNILASMISIKSLEKGRNFSLVTQLSLFCLPFVSLMIAVGIEEKTMGATVSLIKASFLCPLSFIFLFILYCVSVSEQLNRILGPRY